MPEFITEEQYLAVEDIINNPPPGTTDYYMGEWKKHQNRYIDQQFRAGVPDLTPKRTAEKAAKRYDTLRGLKDVYTKGIEAYDITQEPDSQFLTSPDIIARRINRKYLSAIYEGNKIDSSNHDLARTDFAKRFLNREDIMNDVEFFEAVKPYIRQEFYKLETDAKIQEQVVSDYYKGRTLQESLKRLSTFQGVPDENAIKQFRKNMDAIIGPAQPYIDKALDALERRTKGATAEEMANANRDGLAKGKRTPPQYDEQAIEDIKNLILNAHPSHRSKIMKRMMGEAEERGIASVDEVRNIMNEAFDSAKNIFSGIGTWDDMRVESVLSDKNYNTGDVIYSGKLKSITTPEEAREHLARQISGSDSGEFEFKFNEITLDENAAKLLRDAKADMMATVQFGRDVKTLERSVDPFREGWKTDMATTVGGSVGIMLTYAAGSLAGPVGTVAAVGSMGAIYAGHSYDEIRQRYPDLDPGKAQALAITAGGIEGLLDLSQYKIVSKAFSALGVKKALDLTSRSSIGRFTREAGAVTGSTYIFELGIEVIQEGARPIAQALFSTFDEEYKINASQEWADWISAVPHIAVGMIPLAVFSGGAAGVRALNAEPYLKKVLMDSRQLRLYGLTEEQIGEVQGYVQNNMFNAAVTRMEQLSKDGEVLQRRSDTLSRLRADSAIETAEAYNQARRMGILPRYNIDEATGEYVVVDEEGNEKRLADRKAYDALVRENIEVAEQTYAEKVAENIRETPGQVAQVEDFVDLDTLSKTIATIKGLTQDEIESLDNVFGKNEMERQELFDQLTLDLIEKGNVEGLRTFIDGIYKNLPENVRIAIGKDKEEGVEALVKLLTGESVAVKAEGDMTNKNIQLKQADHKVAFQDVSIQDKNAEIDNTFYPAGLKGFDIAKERLQENRKQSYTNSEGLEFVNIQQEQTSVGGRYIQTIVNTLEEQFNVRFFFAKGQKNDQGKYVGNIGVNVDNAIIIDIDQARGSLLNHVLGHEFAHYLENTPAYNEMSKAIIGFSQKQYDDFRAVHGENSQREFISDMVGSNFRDVNFWNKLAKEMYSANPTVADSFIGTVKAYLGSIKEALPKAYTSRDIDTESIQDYDKLQSAIIAGMLKGRADQAQQTGEAKFMAANPNPENRSVEYITRMLRDRVNFALQEIGRAGGQKVGKKRLKEALLEPKTEEQYEASLNYHFLRVYGKIKIEEQGKAKNIGRTMRNIGNRLFKAMLEGNVSMRLLVEAEAAKKAAMALVRKEYEPLTYDELSIKMENPGEFVNEAMGIFNDARQATLNATVKVIEGRLGALVEKLDEMGLEDVSDFYKRINRVIFERTAKEAQDEIDEIYDSLYTEEGLPATIDPDDQQYLTMNLSILKAFGGWRNRSIDEQEQAINQALAWMREGEDTEKIQRIFVNPQTESLVDNSVKEIVNNPNTVERRSTHPIMSGMFSYLDNHLTFSSELELISPSVGTPGRPITSTLQKVNDLLIDSYLTIQDEQIRLQGKALDIAMKIYKTDEKGAAKKLHDMLTEEKIEVNIKGKKVKLKEGYAAYILNVAEQFIYEAQLEDAGFTREVIQKIRKDISEEANELRVKLREDLIKTVKRNNAKLRESGTMAVDPNESFFPVLKLSLTRSVVDAFDIAYGQAIQPEQVNKLLKNEAAELNFDLLDQEVNILDMYHNHAYQTVHKANVDLPIKILKRIFSSKSVREKLNEKIGNEGIVRLFGFIEALEHGGIVTKELNRAAKQFLNGILAGTSRASLGFNLKTYAVNAMSAANILLDASIPTSVKISAITKALGYIEDVNSRRKVNEVIQRRFDAGANALLQIVRGASQKQEPGRIKDISDWSLEKIGSIDAYFLTFSAKAAYFAHYEIGKKEGLQGEALRLFAEKGMVRTINKVAQPNMAATKSYLEQTSNPFLRTAALFMSETRKNLGIEWAALRKLNISKREFIDVLFFNHIVLGTLAFSLRNMVGWLLGEEDTFKGEEWLISVIAGPISGIVMFGAVFDLLLRSVYNEIADTTGFDKVSAYQPSSAVQRTVANVERIFDVFKTDRTLLKRGEDVAAFLEAGGTILNSPLVAGWGSLLDAATDAVKLTTIPKDLEALENLSLDNKK